MIKTLFLKNLQFFCANFFDSTKNKNPYKCIAFIARGYPTSKSANNLLITLFNELMEKYPEYKEYIPKVTEQMVKKVINKLNMKVKKTNDY